MSPLRIWALAAMCGAAFCFIFRPDDIVSSTYTTVQEARADKLFAHGWLPDILPPSTHHIEVHNNLDKNSAWGFFYFARGEYPLFTGHHKLRNPRIEQTYDGSDMGAQWQQNRYDIRTYQEERSHWVFQCTPAEGACEYYMTAQREHPEQQND